MWSLNKCSYTEGFVRIAGQMGGGLVAFPLFHFISEKLNLTPFGGPEFVSENGVDAFISEFVASFLLMWVIYIVSSKDTTNSIVSMDCVLFDFVIKKCRELDHLTTVNFFFPNPKLSTAHENNTAQLGVPLWAIPLHYQTNLDSRCYSCPY